MSKKPPLNPNAIPDPRETGRQPEGATTRRDVLKSLLGGLAVVAAGAAWPGLVKAEDPPPPATPGGVQPVFNATDGATADALSAPPTIEEQIRTEIPRSEFELMEKTYYTLSSLFINPSFWEDITDKGTHLTEAEEIYQALELAIEHPEELHYKIIEQDGIKTNETIITTRQHSPNIPEAFTIKIKDEKIQEISRIQKGEDNHPIITHTKHLSPASTLRWEKTMKKIEDINEKWMRLAQYLHEYRQVTAQLKTESNEERIKFFRTQKEKWRRRIKNIKFNPREYQFFTAYNLNFPKQLTRLWEIRKKRGVLNPNTDEEGGNESLSELVRIIPTQPSNMEEAYARAKGGKEAFDLYISTSLGNPNAIEFVKVDFSKEAPLQTLLVIDVTTGQIMQSAGKVNIQGRSVTRYELAEKTRNGFKTQFTPRVQIKED